MLRLLLDNTAMGKSRKKLNTLKKKTGTLLNVLLTEHAKLTIIIGITLLCCLFIYVYKHPASISAHNTPIEVLPKKLEGWTGKEAFLAVPMKNNRYASLLFTDALGQSVRFISYQRQNEKNEQLHYPEDCLRANGYLDATATPCPLSLGQTTIPFKKIVATRGTQAIVHYYVVFSGDGEALTYGGLRKRTGLKHFGALIEKRLQLNRNNDQLFLFTITATGPAPSDSDARVQSLLRAIPENYFPKR